MKLIYNKKVTVMTAVLILVFYLGGLSVSAVPYQSFSYTFAWGASPCPDPYIPSRLIDAQVLGQRLNNPSDLYIDDEGWFYIADTGNNAVVIATPEGEVYRTVHSLFAEDLSEVVFNAPEGVFVDGDGIIYVADTQNHRIVKLGDRGRTVINVIDLVESDVLGADYSFLPAKLVVDSAERIFVISKNDFQGILELTQDGIFLGYMGTNHVNPTPLDLFWRRVMTRAQRDRLASFVPYEFSNLHLDGQGFVFTVSSSAQEPYPIKRLNPSGQDVLIRQDYMRSASNVGRAGSFYIDVSASDDGSYSAIDYQTGRIYTYNHDGYLLYSFGRVGNRVGTFRRPIAIVKKDDEIFVLDRETGIITVFEMTEYAGLIRQAEQLYNQGKYDESIEAWYSVLRLNANFELAYAQIGKVLHRQERYDEAMEYFLLGNFRGDRSTQLGGYNEAFSRHRTMVMRNYLGSVFSVVLLSLATIAVIYFYKRKKSKKPAGGYTE